MGKEGTYVAKDVSKITIIGGTRPRNRSGWCRLGPYLRCDLDRQLPVDPCKRADILLRGSHCLVSII